MPYLDLPGANGDWASTPDAAPLDITGDLEIRVRLRPDTLNTTYTLLAKRLTYACFILSNGELRFRHHDGSTYFFKDSGTALTTVVSAGEDFWVKVTLDVDNGSSGWDVDFYYSTDDTNDDTAVSWTQLVSTITTATTTSIRTTSEQLGLGGEPNAGIDALAGRLYRVVILDGIGGTRALDADFSDPSTWNFS